MQLCLTLAVAAGVVLAGSPSAAAEAAPPGALACSGCHAPVAVPSRLPRLHGRPAAEIVALMAAYRAGSTPATVMDRIARGFSEAEIEAIAAWYAARK